jgi:hypothetical protein
MLLLLLLAGLIPATLGGTQQHQQQQHRMSSGDTRSSSSTMLSYLLPLTILQQDHPALQTAFRSSSSSRVLAPTPAAVSLGSTEAWVLQGQQQQSRR